QRNIATGIARIHLFISSDGAAVLPANYTFLAADAGTQTFNATLKTVGERTITATDTVTATITGSQTNITVTPAAASTLVVSGFADPTSAGDHPTLPLAPGHP